MKLEQVFKQLFSNYTHDLVLVESEWLRLEKNYSGSNRYYHGLGHLKHIWSELNRIKDKIKNWNAILFSMFYHDIIYKAYKKNNEEASADYVREVMESLSISEKEITLCYQQILATKSHLKSTDSDTNFFIDADLAILGASWEVYHNYTLQVRKEYSIYPDVLYKPGRRKVLQHFLQQEEIFKTTYFRERYEIIARKNIRNELSILSG